MTKETNRPEGLKHGEYKIKIKQINSEKKIILIDGIAKLLNQEELSDGWLQVFNKQRKYMIHHFSIYLSQLPMNLWSKVKRTYTHDSDKDYYRKIKISNYHYSIKFSGNDELVFELYRNMMSTTPNLDRIRELYKSLDENRVKGWLMIRAMKMTKL
jgi:hypothetical protein